MAFFPYNPTRILPSPNDENIFYVFRPLNATSSDVQLLVLNASISETFSDGSLPLSILSDSLPMLGRNTAYSPAVDSLGKLFLYGGDCRNTKDGSMLWEFKDNNATLSSEDAWTQSNLSHDSSARRSSLRGANYLASGIAFSNTADSRSRVFVFGGMCPTSTDGSSSAEWTTEADYSNTMLAIEPAGSSSEGRYQLGVSSSRGPPIAEAGFTITPLEPTFSQYSTDNETRSQNQNFVLLGGHTQTAFINMSQIALFSLPEETWTFLPLDATTESPRTDLAARGTTSIDPRSGHTAVLTQDGKQVVVFGGWVGDIHTAAEPQLAILELGDGYGGSGDWRWTIPSQSGTGPEAGSGIFGHGAAMLPGGVMMITGGYSTSGSNSVAKRADASMSTNNYFFNTTSNTWVSSYTHPQSNSKNRDSTMADAGRRITSTRIGLGAGLTCGVLALIIVVVVYFWYSQRLQRRRDAREAELRHLGLDAHRSSSMFLSQGVNQPGSEMTARDAYMMARASKDGHCPRNNQDLEAERTGLLFEIPSPTRGLRRSLHSRGAYQPAPRYDDGRLARGSGNIHPIDERDEYDQDLIDGSLPVDHEGQAQEPGVIKSAPVLDPFRDPDGSRPPSPQSPARERELEQRNWVSDWAAADALMYHRGRQSPDKTDRTSSSLSDQSARSMVSAQSWQQSVGTMSRSMSQRSAALLFSRPFSPSIENNHAVPPIDLQRAQSVTAATDPNARRTRSLTLFTNPRRTNSSETTPTTAPSFQQLQFESEELLGGYNDRSPRRTQSRAREWMGSVRRAFTGADRSASETQRNGDLSTSSSPTKQHHHGDEAGLPRRAASTGAMLWQKRQGARDWDVECRPSGAEKAGGHEPREAEEEEWDVESAVERRVVQVMFTVPKEKLRVVNRGPDGDGVSMVSRESSVKGTGNDESGSGKEQEKSDEA